MDLSELPGIGVLGDFSIYQGSEPRASSSV